MLNPLQELQNFGQSFWYDNISRDLVRSGRLKKMIDEDGLTGVTSNPTIFEQAINREKTYDNDLHLLVDEGKEVEEIYQALAVTDIQEAADLLLPVFRQTDGRDGYVSLEVSPELAYNTTATVEQARELFGMVDRPNVMIKVPGTPQGLEAVRELIAAGVNINVTLLFSLDQYRGAAQAYMDGLRQWISSGGDPARVASVASFFVSRVDTMVDELLIETGDPRQRDRATKVMGQAAIANAKLAYAIFKELFQGEPFADLRAKGARPQRVLWASTSTKNPNYSDTYYVDALIGPDTVNTMPAATVDAYRDHGRPRLRLEEGLDDAQVLFPLLAEFGIDMDQVMDTLLENGVRAFADSYEELLASIAQKRTRLLRGWGHRSASLGSLQQQVEQTLAEFDRNKIANRIWSLDPSVWKESPEHQQEIGQRLGWLTVVDTMRHETERLRSFADEVRSEGFTDAVLIGMGGSSLAPEVFATCFGVAQGYLKLTVLDSTIPGAILQAERSLDLKRTLFIVSSKSGGTIEVVSLYKYFRSRVEQVVGKPVGSHFVAITDPGTSLGKLASEHRFRRVFLNPSDIGGRFSALSYFGLMPLALVGADLDRLLMRADQATEGSGPDVPALENPGAWLGVIMGEAALRGIDKLSLIISPPIASFGGWLEQLIAESTGKEAKGVLPVEGEPTGNPESYGRDRLFMYVRLDGDATHDAFVSTMEKKGYPVVTQRLHTAYDLGREMFRWEFATAVAGAILKIDPFDQPNVQEAKTLTKKVLDLYAIEGRVPAGESIRADDPGLQGSLTGLLSQIKPGDYVAINAFVAASDKNREVLQAVRATLRDKFKVATTLGFGPRYLHSTGQIHKGGPDKGLYIQITSDDAEDIPIPGESYSFGVLKTAQSVGDYEALKKRGRRILGVHCRADSDIERLLELVRAL
ncbi:MAG: bifunctional transaldolase/phosoglucose isomerase [Thermodesulfobacteriota bacterium]